MSRIFKSEGHTACGQKVDIQLSVLSPPVRLATGVCTILFTAMKDENNNLSPRAGTTGCSCFYSLPLQLSQPS